LLAAIHEVFLKDFIYKFTFCVYAFGSKPCAENKNEEAAVGYSLQTSLCTGRNSVPGSSHRALGARSLPKDRQEPGGRVSQFPPVVCRVDSTRERLAGSYDVRPDTALGIKLLGQGS